MDYLQSEHRVSWLEFLFSYFLEIDSHFIYDCTVEVTT
jgi:hypothetical protein